MSMDIDKDKYNPDEPGWSTNHPRYPAVYWTGCYVEDCRIRTNQRLNIKPPSYANVYRQYRTYEYISDTYLKYHPRNTTGMIATMVTNLMPTTCPY